MIYRAYQMYNFISLFALIRLIVIFQLNIAEISNICNCIILLLYYTTLLNTIRKYSDLEVIIEIFVKLNKYIQIVPELR